MVFALSTDDRTLHVFTDAETAVRHAEGVDVEDGVWLFFSEDGVQLEPVFTRANRRGQIAVASGRYTLHPGAASSANLLDHLGDISCIDGPPELSTVEAIRARLISRFSRPPYGGSRA